MKSTFPRAKSYSVCDQYWSKDNLIANIILILIIDVPQHIECTSIVGFIDKIIVKCITILVRIGTSFNPFRNDSDRNHASLHEQVSKFAYSIMIEGKMFFEITLQEKHQRIFFRKRFDSARSCERKGLNDSRVSYRQGFFKRNDDDAFAHEVAKQY